MKKMTVLICAVALAGCTEGVLAPKGPIAAAERQILFNALGIMLAIADLSGQEKAGWSDPREAV